MASQLPAIAFVLHQCHTGNFIFDWVGLTLAHYRDHHTIVHRLQEDGHTRLSGTPLTPPSSHLGQRRIVWEITQECLQADREHADRVGVLSTGRHKIGWSTQALSRNIMTALYCGGRTLTEMVPAKPLYQGCISTMPCPLIRLRRFSMTSRGQ